MHLAHKTHGDGLVSMRSHEFIEKLNEMLADDKMLIAHLMTDHRS